jgi:hypothetical protein
MIHKEGLGLDPNMSSPFKRGIFLKLEDAEIVGVWPMVPKSHPLEMYPYT